MLNDWVTGAGPGSRWAGWVGTAALMFLTGTVVVGDAVGQETGPGLVIPVPAPSRIVPVADTFVAPGGGRRGLEIFRPLSSAGPVPIVLFANGSGAGLPKMRGYRDWARLVADRGMAGVLYEGPAFDPAKSVADHLRASVAHLDSVIAVLRRRGAVLGVDPTRVVVWAGSAQTATGTPFALGGDRPVVGYVLYYGSGQVVDPRIDVPVLVARAGLDSPALNAELDALVRQLTDAGAPVTMVSHPAGSHGFDIYDSTRATARVIEQTLEFMSAVVEPGFRAAIVGGAPEAKAAGAFAAGRWGEAERLYTELGRARPSSRIVAWRLGLAQLANGNPGSALAAFDRARTLGQGGARDIGLPATRAALRAGNEARAVEWVRWALESFPRIRAEIAADQELAPLLEHPLVRGR